MYPNNSFSGKRFYDSLGHRAIYVVQGNKLRDAISSAPPEYEIRGNRIYSHRMPSIPIYEIRGRVAYEYGSGIPAFDIR